MLSRCHVCPRNFMPIPASGPSSAQMVWIGERPGTRENERGQVFCGPSGQELDETYMRIAGLDRDEQYVTNAVKCWAENNRTPSDKEVDSCARHFLIDELDAIKPEIVVLMGGRACRIADRKLKIDTHHGIPYYGTLLRGAWEGWVWPMYHPALGMHDTSKMANLLEDFENFGDWLNGRWHPTIAPAERNLDYQLIRSSSELVQYLSAPYRPWARRVPVDTETHGGASWSVQLSLREDTGRMVLANDKESLRLLQKYLVEMRAEIVLHNAPQDLDELERLGIRPPSFRDTQQEAFQQCTLPQGLKPLAYRLTGVEMHSWEDTVYPASIKALQAWLEDVYVLAAEGMYREKVTVQKTMVCGRCGGRGRGPTCRKKYGHGAGLCNGSMKPLVKRERLTGAIEGICKHVLTYMGRNDEYNPWDALAAMRVDGLRGVKPEPGEMEYVESEIGPMPLLGIGNCELSEAVRYGCGDSDMTGQVADKLEERRKGRDGEGQWPIAEGDEDR